MGKFEVEETQVTKRGLVRGDRHQSPLQNLFFIFISALDFTVHGN